MLSPLVMLPLPMDEGLTVSSHTAPRLRDAEMSMNGHPNTILCWNVILVTFLCCLFERYVSVISDGGKSPWRELPMAGSSENFRDAEFCLRGHCCILTAFVRSMVISGIALVMRE